MVASACAGGDENGQTGSDAAGEPHELAIAAQSGPNSLDPAQLVDGQQMFVWASVLDTLLIRENNTGEILPNAAESWEYNDEGTELTLRLREDMTFSDGSGVDAHAVVATMLRNKETPGVIQEKFSDVADVVAEDDHTVVVHFDRHDPKFVPNLTMGTGAIGHPDTLEEERTATDPVGSGPYVLDVERSVDGSSYVLHKRDDYWNADAFPFETVTVRVLQDPTAAFNALQAGEVNVAPVDSEVLPQLDTEQYQINEIEAQALMSLAIVDRAGENFPALGDLRVRQALNHAIDRQSILDNLLDGLGLVTQQIFSPYGEVYDESLNDTYEYDPELGRELVEEAGYAGETFEIPSTYLTTSFESAISQAFEDVGLGVEWVPVAPQQAQSAHLSGDYGITFQMIGFLSDENDAYQYYAPTGYVNPQRYADERIEELFDAILTPDFEEALPAYRELNEYAVEQALTVPIAFIGSTWASRDGVEMVDDGSSAIQSVRLFDVTE